jgi:hypothetical protein
MYQHINITNFVNHFFTFDIIFKMSYIVNMTSPTIGTIDILGKSVPVVDRHSESADEDLGLYDHRNCIIWLDSTLPKKQQTSTLIHESVHGISAMLGLKLTEQQVLGLEAGLYSMGFRPKIKKKNA